MKLATIATVILYLAIGTAPAHAATLFTPPAWADTGQLFLCKIANVSTKPRTVTADLIDQNGTVLSTTSLELAAGRTTRISVVGAFQNYRCRFSVKGGKNTVRGSSTVSTDTEDLIVIPAY